MPRLALPWRRSPVEKAAVQPIAAKTPPAIEQAMAEQGMTGNVQLGPGRPMNPAWGYSTRPRQMDYPAGVNIATGDNRQAWGRTSYETLRNLIDAYDIARDCINHKIDELVSMEPLLLPADGVNYDVDAAIDAARVALEFPDRENSFEAWLSKWLEDVFRYDAGHLYRRRNYDGDVIALETVDGTTLAPLLDQYGRRPKPPALAWEQVIKGLRTTGFTTDDLIPTIRRPQPNNPFGLAPIESVLITVNTDVRHQWHFLQMFTEGSIPAGFMELPPDVSSPDQVDTWQQYWDSFLIGDQAKKHQIIAVPSGSKLTETRPASFDRAFPEWLAVRTAMAYGVVPQDLGLTMDVNRATGETQTDMQFRVNTLPLVLFVQRVLTRYLRYDLGLPVQVKLDTGREKEDRLQEAQTWAVYIANAIASPDEAREELLGLPTDNERPTPRGFLSPRTGFVPLRSAFAISGPIDPETGAPVDDQALDTTPFDGTGGVLADKTPGGSQFKRAPIDPDDPTHPDSEHVVPGSDVLGTTPSTKPVITDPSQGAAVEAVQADANALTVTTDKVDREDAPVAKAAEADELAAFRRFVKARARAGRWRDFAFTDLDPAAARDLNRHARFRVRKAAGQVAVAGLAVVAADTGRVLMLQRALDPADPAGGTWEFPGGHVEDGELPGDAARREWAEETGLETPYADGSDAGPDWTSPGGVYAGFVQVIPAELCLPIFDRADGTNPDDPDGDQIEALAWWDPATLPDNPAVRPELADTLDAVLPLLEEAVDPKGWTPSDDGVGPAGTDVRDGRSVDVVPAGQLAKAHASGAQLTDRSGRVIAEDGPCAAVVASPLVGSVPVVRPSGPQKQVVRPDARRGVAGVADGQPLRDRSVGQFPGEAVSRDGLSVLRAEDAVATPVGVGGGDPQPAVARAVNLAPKAHVSGVHEPTVAPVTKSWRDGAPKTPQHEVDLRLVDFWAPKIAQALAAMFTAEQLRAAVETASGSAPTVAKDTESDLRAQIADAARARLAPDANTAQIEAVVRQVIADGYLAGGAAARRQLGPNSVTVDGATGEAIASVDWDRWEPGDVDAAIQTADGGLTDLLNGAGVRIKGITGSALDDLGNAIADGLLDGSSVDDIASSLSDWATGFRAERIAHTESARAVTRATLDSYQANGIGEWTLVLSANACPECEDVADNGPYPASDDGDAPPIHPMCRCAATPVLDEETRALLDSAGGGDDSTE